MHMKPLHILALACFLVVPHIILQVDGVGHKQRQEQRKRSSNELEVHVDESHSERRSHTGGKRKGGHKQQGAQRAAESTSVSTHDTADQPLTRELINDWASGKITALQVQRYALRAMQQVGLISYNHINMP